MAAILGKVAGVGLPALLVASPINALVLGLSMVPRAEIAMVIVHQARQFVSAVVPEVVFTGMVLVIAGTCTLAPLFLRPLLNRTAGTRGFNKEKRRR